MQQEAPRGRGAGQVFEVAFGRATLLGRVANDSSRFAGRGSIEIGTDSIRIRGKRPRRFRFGAQEAYVLNPAQVFNLERTGKSIHFRSGKGSIRFVARSVEEAQRIAACLPRQQTAEFAHLSAERTDFEQRLERFSPWAPVTPLLVAINVAVFVAMAIGGAGVIEPNSQVSIAWGSDFGPLTMGGQWWRLFTSIFIHFGLLHLGLNMLVLYQNGRLIERMFGSVRFLLLYLFAGLAGSMASLLWNPMVNGAGASGAIFGLFGGMLAFVLNPRNAVPPSVMKQHGFVTLAFVAYNLVFGVVHGGIDNAAHVGGLLGGFAMGFLLARPLEQTARAELGLARGAVAVAACMALLGLLWWPLMHPSSQARGAQEFELAWTKFGAQQQAAQDAVKAMQASTHLKHLSGAEMAQAIERDIEPKWDALYLSASAPALDPNDIHYPLQQAVIRYAGDQRKAWRLYAQALPGNDGQLMQQAQAAVQNAAVDSQAIGAAVEAIKRHDHS